MIGADLLAEIIKQELILFVRHKHDRGRNERDEKIKHELTVSAPVRHG